MKIGVLALQGAFAEHEKALTALGAEVKEIRQLRDFDDSFDGIIIPGGESTVMGKLL
ncbi:MAG: pyridoxal 5'-phosphate synthase glutaminase subunit PdxT, partial [Ruminococcus sp.]|nr:pyridoxal 5'-phosphate synthase glutaminase subunit PdxT [Ruminococcus sp.]